MHKCPICKRQISKQAASCPGCGQPANAGKKGKASGGASLDKTLDGIGNTLDTLNNAADAYARTKIGRWHKKFFEFMAGLAIICGIITILYIKMSPYRLPEADYATALAQCSELIEQRAEFGFAWTDNGDIKDRFHTAWWKDDREDEVVELTGTELNFLDNSGTEQRMSYTCEYNIVTHQAEGVNVRRHMSKDKAE